jgi:hypothetical protein
MPARKITFKGKTYPSRRALAMAFGKPYSQVQRRLSAGYIYFDYFGYHQTLMDYDMEDCLSATFLNKL